MTSRRPHGSVSSAAVPPLKERTYQNDFKSMAMTSSVVKDRRMSLDGRITNLRRNPFSHGGALIGTRSGPDEELQHSLSKRKERTLSCDRGMELMVKRFYAEKFDKAKKAADKDLASFIDDVAGMLAPSMTTVGPGGPAEAAKPEAGKEENKNERHSGTTSQENTNVLLRKLKDMAQALLETEPEALMSGKALKEGARVTWECMWRAMGLEETKECATVPKPSPHPMEKVRELRTSQRISVNARATRVKVLSTKLLWIISKMKHRADYLEADYSDEFVAWAAAAFRSKHARKQYRKSMASGHGAPPPLPIDSVEIMEDTLAGKYVVCRICEGVIQEEYLAAHTALCSDVAIGLRRCETCDTTIQSLEKKLDESLKEEQTRTAEAPEGDVERPRLRSSPRAVEQPRTTLFRLLKESLAEKEAALNAMQAAIARIEQSPHAAVGSRFREKPSEGPRDVVGAAAGGSVRPSIHDFDIIKPISRGSFGSVLLGRKKSTGDIYAIKVVKKSSLIEKNQMDFIANERNILAFTDNPFVVKLYYSFQSANNLYMVMEFLPGGDCFSLLRNLIVFPENLARHYVAELVHALGYLHTNGIVHRDLKPDNLLIGADGHLKLTDFGLSQMGLLDRKDDVYEWKKVGGMMESENKIDASCVGTPDYLAPEIFLGTGHGPEVDWWAVGCITYEFLVGITPFYADTCEEIFASVISNNIQWPDGDDELSADAVDLISKLLAIEPTDRLGAKGADEVKAHPWFAEVDWANLRNTTSPFVPKLGKSEDTFYFEARNAIYHTTWEGDTSTQAEEGEEQESHIARVRNFSIINIPQLMTLNQSLVDEKQDARSGTGGKVGGA